ncbi:MAG: asparagine synthase (glutamine-hydrolyzing) [Kofleriaceae bacterium]
MCGIAGLVAPDGLPDCTDDLARFDRALAHRGPNDRGEFRDPRVAFVHRRLSILDLSSAARQPMTREGITIVYNGEVYNFRELRRELGVACTTESDTEVILAAYRKWGSACVGKFRGMFAFAIHDAAKRKVVLARDHLGIKPLYLARRDGTWMFASELKAICAWSRFRSEVDPAAIASYLQFLWIPGTATGLRDVRKLEPGTVVELDLARDTETETRYWRPEARERDVSRDELAAELERAVKEQLVSDVPIGAFLSGGLDSSLVVALTGRSVHSYTVGYRATDLAYDIVPDDMPWAQRAAKYLDVPLTPIELSPNVVSVLPKVVDALDEPIGDPAALSSYLICEAASERVMLSGVGADELFGGYPRQRAMLYGSYYRALPVPLRSLVHRVVETLPAAGTSSIAKLGRAGQKFVVAADRPPLHHYIAMESYLHTELEPPTLEGDPLHQAIAWDLMSYLPNLNLAYTDRTAMAHGVEVRVPFLDQRVVELALALRSNELVHWYRGRLEGKWLLKKVAERWLPRNLVWRKKAGFGAPVRAWLRRDLTVMRRDLLPGVVDRGWIDRSMLERLQTDFDTGRRDNALPLWMLLSLELWARRFLDNRA